MNTRILVTGATGLIGSSLIRRLLYENDTCGTNVVITALVRDVSRARDLFGALCSREDFDFLEGDVCDASVLIGKSWDVIVHAAGNSHPKAFATYPVETMKANLLGTMNLLEHARVQADLGKPVKKLVFLSSGEVYGNTVLSEESSGCGFDETTPGMLDSMQMRACYPESKRAAETLCKCYFEEYRIPTVVARLAYIFGTGVPTENSRADAQFLKKASAHEDIVMKSKGEQVRSYCYVRDAVSAILTIMDKGVPGEAYNVANKDLVMTIREYAEKLAKTFGVKVVFDLPDAIEAAGYSKMKTEILNPTKLYDLGWKPEYSLDEAMCEMKNMGE